MLMTYAGGWTGGQTTLAEYFTGKNCLAAQFSGNTGYHQYTGGVPAIRCI